MQAYNRSGVTKLKLEVIRSCLASEVCSTNCEEMRGDRGSICGRPGREDLRAPQPGCDLDWIWRREAVGGVEREPTAEEPMSDVCSPRQSVSRLSGSAPSAKSE